MQTRQRNQNDTAATRPQHQAAPMVPPVDIIEDQEGITLKADLPGVAKEDLSIGIDGDTMTIEARVKLGEAARMEPVYAEVRVAEYKRSFVLGADLDSEKVEANIRNGVLTVRLHKRERAKPRRIDVRSE